MNPNLVLWQIKKRKKIFATLTKEKKESQNSITTTEHADIKKITRKHYQKFYAHVYDHLDKINQFFER